MPGFWQFPTVSMGLGTSISAIYQARFMRYLRRSRDDQDAGGARSGHFSVTARPTSPRVAGGDLPGGREKLDNLIFVVNCNLQRLDGPVRGNGKIIQELEAGFRGEMDGT